MGRRKGGGLRFGSPRQEDGPDGSAQGKAIFTAPSAHSRRKKDRAWIVFGSKGSFSSRPGPERIVVVD
jgi:hypothetical protein